MNSTRCATVNAVLMFIATTGVCSSAGVCLAQANAPVYLNNSLEAGWSNWSWSTTTNFATASPAHGGTSLAVTHTAAWAGLYLHTDAALPTSQYTSIRFWIHGGSAGGQGLQFSAVDATNTWSAAVPIAAPIAGTWTQVEISLTNLGLADVGGLVWQETQGHSQSTYYLDDVEFVEGEPPPPGQGPALAVDVAADRHAISPLIYGLNFADQGFADEIDLPINRWGGNSTTRYNWQNDTSNRASDWYFENIPNDNSAPGQLPNGSASDDFVETNLSTGADTLMTVPLIGWTPKERANACGFSVSKYGAQQSVDPWRTDCGNGVLSNGTVITWNDATDTSIAIGPSFVQAWMNHLIGRYGNAGAGGVRFYDLDNEPMLWNSTHRDVHPTPVGYDELRDRTVQYAAAIKATDAGAQTLGPVLWGWSAYFFSALDVAAGGDWWNTRPDRRAHGDVPFVAWYLQQMQAYQQAHGTRILDYLNLHYYPQADVALQSAGDAAKQARRLRSTRSLWDPTYVDESWIGEPVYLIPRMRDWVATNYPGTKLAVTEYNWGGLESINGALAQADVLGIFGREGLDLATLWDPPSPNQPGAYAFRIYRNYDGGGAKFGETSVRATSADQSKVSIYAAETSSGALTIVLINKNTQALTSTLTLSNFGGSGPAAAYRYSGADLDDLVSIADVAFSGGAATLDLPASSITLLVLGGGQRPGDLDDDGDVDGQDLALLLAAFLSTPGAPNWNPAADLDGNGIVEPQDLAMLLAVFGT